MKIALLAVSSLVLALMVYVVVSTSLQSNLFDLIRTWDPQNPMAPWFSATLWDFYANVFFIFLWVVYKERSFWRSAMWLLLLTGLGSIATAAYVVIQLLRLKEDEGINELFFARRLS